MDNTKKSFLSVDGNTAAALASYNFTEVAAIYPITPSSPMAELVDVYASQGKKNAFGTEVKVCELQSEAGASGAVFAVMGAMLYVVIRNHGRIQDISVRQMMIMAGFSLYFGFTSTGVDNAAHVGGMVCGFILAAVLYHPGNFSGRTMWKDVSPSDSISA